MSLKLVAALGAAVLATAAVAWSASGTFAPKRAPTSAAAAWRPGNRPPAPPPAPPAAGQSPAQAPAGPSPAGGLRLGEDGAPRPAWVQPLAPPPAGWSFAPIADPAAAARSIDDGSRALEDHATRSPTLGALGGASKIGLIQSWRTFIRPVITRDPAAFAAAVAQLGGIVANAAEGAPDPAAQLYGRLSALLGESSLDFNAASTRIADPKDQMDVPAMPTLPPGIDLSGAGAPMMVMALREDGPDGSTERRAVSVPLHNVFPNAAKAAQAGAPTVEIWTPAAIAGGDRSAPDAGIAVFMVWDAPARSWAPLAMRITLETETAKQAFQAARGN